MLCLHRNICIYTVCMTLVRNIINYQIISFECIFKLFKWSRFVELPSSDEMKMFYTEHDFQVDIENFELNLKFMQREYNISAW